MKTYHITFLESDKASVSTGMNYFATSPIGALIKFENEYPNAVFLYVASQDMFNLKA